MATALTKLGNLALAPIHLAGLHSDRTALHFPSYHTQPVGPNLPEAESAIVANGSVAGDDGGTGWPAVDGSSW